MKRGVQYAVMAIVAAAVCQTASAKTLQVAINKMADDIKVYMEANEIGDVSISNFVGPPDSSAGRLVSNELKKQLEEDGVTVAKFASSRRQVTGRFSYEKDPDDDLGVVLLKAELADGNGVPEKEFRRKVEIQEISSTDDVATLLGVTVDLSEAEDEAKAAQGNAPATPAQKKKNLVKARNAVLEKSRDKPSFSLASAGGVAASEKSPFRVEVLIKNGPAYEPLEVVDFGGFAFAPLQEGNTYAVRIHNTAPHDVAVELAIDGVNTLSLTEVPAYGHGRWIAPAGGVIQINGWHKTDEFQHEFVVTTEEDAVASKIGAPTAQIGTITASFFHAWDPTREPTPEIERALGTANSLGIGTGEGPRVVARSQRVFRKMGKQLLASVSIRYENPDPKDLPDDLPPIN